MNHKFQSAIDFYIRILLYMLASVALRAVVLLPLCSLFIFSRTQPAFWLFLLTPVMYLLLLRPLRYSFADALVQEEGRRYFSYDRCWSLEDYFAKLTESLKHDLFVLLWAVPLAVLSVWCIYLYKTADAFTLLTDITGLGQNVSGILCKIRNFFGGIFGAEAAVPSANTMMDGVLTIAAFFGIAAVILLFGAVYQSSSRYIWVLARRNGTAPGKLQKSQLELRRSRQMLMSLVNLVLWIPVLALTLKLVKDVVSSLSTQLMQILAGGPVLLPELGTIVSPLLIVFFCFYLPLLPIRRILTCAFAAAPALRSSRKGDN